MIFECRTAFHINSVSVNVIQHIIFIIHFKWLTKMKLRNGIIYYENYYAHALNPEIAFHQAWEDLNTRI